MGSFHTSSARRTLGSYVPSYALAPVARAALEALGYAVVPVTARGPLPDPGWRVDVRLADARVLERLPKDDVPVILLENGGRPLPEDVRVAGSVPRPAEVATLYPILQRILEAQPRRAARAVANIPARCTRADRRWAGEVLHLSQAGCLFRTTTDLPTGVELNLSFPLPLGRMVSTRARISTRNDNGAGLDFLGMSAPTRDAIGAYVQRSLATSRV
jgi:hypothetical protein